MNRQNPNRKPWYKNKNTWQKIGKGALTVGKVASDVASLAALINVEFKAIYSNIGASPPLTGTFMLLNGCARGSDINQRDGRSILNKSFELKVDIKQNSANTAGTHVRLIFFLDKMPQTATPALGDLLDTSAGSDPCTQLRNLTNRKRFVILKDKHIVVDPYNTTAQFEYYRKLGTHTIFGSGNAGTIADIQEGALFLLALSDAATNKEPNVTGNWRIRFIDN